MIFAGIDPGLGGAIALLTTSRTGDVRAFEVHDVPTFEISRGGRQNTRQLNMHEVARILDRPINYALLERVGAMPKQGVASAFTFGKVAGQLEALLAASGTPYELIEPPAWKQRFRLTGKDKCASRETATRLLPMASDQFARKRDDGRAEAALMALMAMELSRKIEKGENDG